MKRLTACVVACGLVAGLLARTAGAQEAADIKVSAGSPYIIIDDKPNAKLKADVARLIADTKAGKRSVLPSTQFPAPQRNNLSKTVKIGIIVGIAVVVIAIIVWKSYEYDCESHCVGF